jgi:hypothetical protein
MDMIESENIWKISVNESEILLFNSGWVLSTLRKSVSGTRPYFFSTDYTIIILLVCYRGRENYLQKMQEIRIQYDI